MTWTKLSDDWNTHPKMLKLNSRDARLFWVDCLTYCNSHHTDGEFPIEAVRQIGGELSKKSSEICLQKLLEVGLLDRKKDGSGFVIHNFLAYNPSRSELDEKRESTRKRVESFRKRVAGNAVTSTHVTPPCNTAPVPSRPEPVPTLTDQIHICDEPKFAAPPEVDSVKVEPVIGPPKSTRVKKAFEDMTGREQVIETYFVEYERARGVKPLFKGREAKSTDRLIDAVKGNHARAMTILRNAYADSFWQGKATINTIANEPAKFDGQVLQFDRKKPVVQSGHWQMDEEENERKLKEMGIE